MEEDRLARHEPRDGQADDVSRSCEARFRMADDAPLLRAFRIEPAVEHREPLAAVIDLRILDAHPLPVHGDRRPLPPPVAHARDVFRQVNRRVRVVPDAQQQHARVELVSPAPEDTSQVFPKAIEPELPSADRLGRAIEVRFGTQASVDVRLCVTPAGQVSSVELHRGSTMDLFDQAVLSDVRDWQFAAQPGPATLKSCEIATIVYRTQR